MALRNEKSFWAHVSADEGLVLKNYNPLTPEMFEGKYRDEILLTVDPDVSRAMRHHQTSFALFQKVKKMFVGIVAS